MKQQQKPKKEFAPLTIVPRDQWGALPPQGALEPMGRPYHAVVFTHTRTKECYSNEQCIKFVKELQKRNMEEEGMPDVQFNWIVGFKGHVYEGRGWDLAATFTEPRHLHLLGPATLSTIVVAYIGTFLERFPSDEMFNTSSLLLRGPLLQDMFDPEFKILPHMITKPEKKPRPDAAKKDQQKPQAVTGQQVPPGLKKRMKKYDDVDEKKKLFFNLRDKEGSGEEYNVEE